MSDYRTGIGWDVHRLSAGRPLILGGVTVPSELGLEGHSDADVLSHAITDAILGAASLGDIGMHFPDTDPRWKDCDSLVFLRHAQKLTEALGYRIVNAPLKPAQGGAGGQFLHAGGEQRLIVQDLKAGARGAEAAFDFGLGKLGAEIRAAHGIHRPEMARGWPAKE